MCLGRFITNQNYCGMDTKLYIRLSCHVTLWGCCQMNVVYQLLQAKKQETERLERQGKVKYEYDSDEDTEGGTWEHKRWANSITVCLQLKLVCCYFCKWLVVVTSCLEKCNTIVFLSQFIYIPAGDRSLLPNKKQTLRLVICVLFIPLNNSFIPGKKTVVFVCFLLLLLQSKFGGIYSIHTIYQQVTTTTTTTLN